MNTYTEFKRLLRKAKVPYKLYGNTDGKQRLYIIPFRIYMVFTADNYVEIVSYSGRWEKLGIVFNLSTKRRLSFAVYAPETTTLLIKLLRFQLLTSGQIELIAGVL